MRAAVLALRDGDREELGRWLRSSTLRAGLAQRARIVLLAADGLANAEIARTVGVSVPTVRAWRERYVCSGPAGLADAPRSGRPKQVDDRARQLSLRCRGRCRHRLHQMCGGDVKGSQKVGEGKGWRPFGRRKLYDESRLTIHLHFFGVRMSEVETHDLCAIVRRVKLDRDRHAGTQGGLTDPLVDALGNHGGDVQEVVLVDDVKLVQAPEGMPLQGHIVRSGVRLRPLDNCEDFVRHSSESDRGISLKPLLVVRDKEFGPPVGNDAVGRDDVPDEVVEGRPQVVEHFARGEAPPTGDTPTVPDLDDLLSFVLYLDDDSVVLQLRDESRIGAFDSLNLAVCPVESSADGVEVVDGHALPLGHE